MMFHEKEYWWTRGGDLILILEVNNTKKGYYPIKGLNLNTKRILRWAKDGSFIAKKFKHMASEKQKS